MWAEITPVKSAALVTDVNFTGLGGRRSGVQPWEDVEDEIGNEGKRAEVYLASDRSCAIANSAIVRVTKRLLTSCRS